MKIKTPLPLPPKSILARMSPEDRAEWAQWASDLDAAYRSRLSRQEHEFAWWGLVTFLIGAHVGMWVIVAIARIL